MAKANPERVEIVPAREAVYEDRVTLELTKDEAEVLASVLGGGKYGGETSPLFDALVRAGVRWDVYNVRFGLSDYTLEKF